MEDINIYVLNGKQDIYEKIFKEKIDFITGKDYGVIQKRCYSQKQMKDFFLKNIYKI